MNDAPIGVFDSGLGGLTVWSELYKKLPHESLLYFGDGKNCPYGDKTQAEVTAHVDEAVRRMLDAGVKMVVIACNAATAMAIDYLRRSYSIPFIGLEPAVKPAALSSHSGVIGVLATAATLRGRLFQETSRRYADRVEILSAVGRGFVELVEADREHTSEAVETVARVVQPMLDRGADRLVLGCTHYPFLQDALREVIGAREVELMNPAAAIERRVESLLEQHDLQASADHRPEYTFLTAADEAYRQRLMTKSEQARQMNFE